MLSFPNLCLGFLDTLTGHLALTAFLLAVTGERAVRQRLKKLPLLLLSPFLALLFSAILSCVPQLGTVRYYICSFAVLAMCTVWVRWAWQFDFWRALAAACMAAIFQVAAAAPSATAPLPFAAAAGLHLAVSIAVSLLLYKLHFGTWFRLLLDSEPAPHRTALLLLTLEVSMEVLLRLGNGVRPHFLTAYYLVVILTTILVAALVTHLARQLDAARKMQVQQDIIAQQRLYEQNLESIRQEVRSFRHDCKNLLAGLSCQAGEEEALRRALSELDAGFDLRLGRKIRASAQIGNVQIPEVRSFLLHKLAAMQENGVAYHLEVLYPLTAVAMDIWDFVRCLGILLDNAAEAARDAEPPCVEIVLLAQDGRVFLRISNPYTNRLDPGKMWREGWSTKGEGRGLGLPGYQRIVSGYPNASPCTRWENGVFVQELTVEGRQ